MQDWISSNAAAPPSFKKPPEALARHTQKVLSPKFKIPNLQEILKMVHLPEKISPLKDNAQQHFKVVYN